MGCCSSQTQSTLKPLKNGNLLAAQSMKVTKSGHIINSKPVRKLMLQKEADKIARDPSCGQDFQTVFNLPLSACNKLTKFVYLSGIASLTKENLEKLGITLIINATYEWPNIEVEGITCYRVPVDDGENDDISVYFDEVCDKIEENAQNGNKTLVHCMAGASRSTTLVLAYLMKYEKINLKNAFISVKKRRETARPNKINLKNAFISVKKRRETARPNVGFWEQLIKYEIKIKGQASVKMLHMTVDTVQVAVPDFYEKDYPDLYKREIEKQFKDGKDKLNNLKPKSQKQFNAQTNTYE
ncbi:unnamed protein product [Oppiella nova]|uniref:Uncharacterized protein n=1 Tax=Oppiella nova TaxID=334625 RepID=A0A7R9QFZ4_9ACAR|nr:unnamed protein product [Oppiella nova]CAG2165075.1 unnamed protein product [Oppiella nova]